MQIRGKELGREPYVIAEIGCNHCGQESRAADLIYMAADCGVNAVKFQQRTPRRLFAASEHGKPYDSPNSYGKTYLEHREALDLDEDALCYFRDLSAGANVDFIVTPFTEYDVDIVDRVGVDAVKVSSFDVENIPLLHLVADIGKPVILSTGGATYEDIDRALDWFPFGNIALLHCVSKYPTSDSDLNLHNILGLKEKYPKYQIGLSTHHPGIDPIKYAYMLGARVFEFHITDNRSNKGTDHSFSLEPKGIREICEALKRIPVMLGAKERPAEREYNPALNKMAKSYYAAETILEGTKLGSDMAERLAPRSEDGFLPYELGEFCGKRAKRTINQGELLMREDVY